MRNAAVRSNLLVPEVREVMDIRQASTTWQSRPIPSINMLRGLCARLQAGQPLALQALPLDEWMDRQSDLHAAEAEIDPQQKKPVRPAF